MHWPLSGLRLSLAVALAAFVVLSPVADARVALTPALGDWEGVGPNGLPLSFAFKHERVHIAGRLRDLIALRDLVVSFPTACAQLSNNSQAFAYPRAEYTGPGSPPVTFHFHNPKRFEIYIRSAPGFNVGLGFFLQGLWLSAQRGTVSEPIPGGVLKGCGWPTKKLTWQLRPGKRVKVASGTWTGTVAAADVAKGSVSATVGAGGRTVDHFHLSYACSDGASSSLDFAPAFTFAGKPTSEFVSPSGSFAGTAGTVNGVQLRWTGTFGSDGVLRGTFTGENACNGDTGALTGTFTARHTGARRVTGRASSGTARWFPDRRSGR